MFEISFVMSKWWLILWISTRRRAEPLYIITFIQHSWIYATFCFNSLAIASAISSMWRAIVVQKVVIGFIQIYISCCSTRDLRSPTRILKLASGGTLVSIYQLQWWHKTDLSIWLWNCSWKVEETLLTLYFSPPLSCSHPFLYWVLARAVRTLRMKVKDDIAFFFNCNVFVTYQKNSPWSDFSEKHCVILYLINTLCSLFFSLV